jgi:hypothetical protein
MPKGIPKSGSRKPGAGRKQSELGPTETIAFRVPAKEKDRLKNLIGNLIDNYIDNLKPIK